MEQQKKQGQLKTTKKHKLLQAKRIRRARRTRVKVQGTQARPRLSVMRSSRYIYVQLIDDQAGHTLVSSKGLLKDALRVGEAIAKKAIDKKLTTVVFDKGAYTYHGRVKELAEGARNAGLSF